jgi:hypothetical protein
VAAAAKNPVCIDFLCSKNCMWVTWEISDVYGYKFNEREKSVSSMQRVEQFAIYLFSVGQ